MEFLKESVEDYPKASLEEFLKQSLKKISKKLVGSFFHRIREGIPGRISFAWLEELLKIFVVEFLKHVMPHFVK